MNSKPLKAIYIVRGFTDYTVGLVNAAAKQVEAHLILTAAGANTASLFSPDVHLFQSQAPRVSSPGNIPALKRMYSYITKVKPDIIHIQSGVIWELALKHLFPSIPFVTTCHDVTNHPVHSKFILTPQYFITRSLAIADAVIVHSPRLKDYAVERFDHALKNKPVYSIPHGIIARYGTGAASIEPKGTNILMLGTLSRWKGVEVLIEAEARVREALPNVSVIIAGQAESPDYYRSLVKPEQHIDMRLRLQTGDEIKELFNWADVLVLPYVEASQSGVLQLGFAFGMPAVVSDAGGLPDVITHGENGLIAPTRNAAAFASNIIRLLTDNKLREHIISNVITCRDTTYNWDHIFNAILDVYNNVITT